MNSIEQLDTEADTNGSTTQWNLISVSPDVLSGRTYPIVMPINSSEILIMGGDEFGSKSDLCVLNMATQEVTRDKSSLELSDPYDEFDSLCFFFQFYVTRKGEFITMMQDSNM